MTILSIRAAPLILLLQQHEASDAAELPLLRLYSGQGHRSRVSSTATLSAACPTRGALDRPPGFAARLLTRPAGLARIGRCRAGLRRARVAEIPVRARDSSRFAGPHRIAPAGREG